MNKQSFSTFQEASSFARSKAQELGRIVKIERNGNDFVIFYDQASNHHAHNARETNPNHYRYNPNDWWERHLKEEEEERREEEKKQKRREDEQRIIRAEAEERAKRKPYLDDREKYFNSLTDKGLDDLWANREDSDMEQDEIFILRGVIRDRKGINTIPDVRANMNFCPRCSLQVGNCTCDRSWW